MPKVGDRVIVEGTKIGNPKREGTLLGVVGPLINVAWSDGTTSLFKPGAGAVSFEPRNGKARAATPAAAATKPAATAAKKPSAAAKKPAGKTATKAEATKGRTAAKPSSGTKKSPSAKKAAKPRAR